MTSDAVAEARARRQRMAAQRKAAKEKEIADQLKKRKRLYYYIGGGVAFLIFLIWLGFQPTKGPIQYGICRTFLELELKFPQTIKMTYVEVFDKSLRMYYTYNDAFGSVKSEMLECDFRPFSLMNIESVKKNRKPVAQEKVDYFNRMVPIVAGAKHNLIIPALPKDDLMSLRRED